MCGYVFVCFCGFFCSFLCRRTPILLSHGILLFLMLLFDPLLPCIILLWFYHGRFLCPCRQDNGGIRATSTRDTGRSFPISRHTRLPVLPVSTSHLHDRTWCDEYVCPAACLFSQASVLLIVKLGCRCRTFSHTPSVEL